MSDSRIAELRALLAEATPGPWEQYDDTRTVRSTQLVDPDWPQRGKEIVGDIWRDETRALVLAAVNTLPALLDVVEFAMSGGSVHAECLRDRESAGYCDNVSCRRGRDVFAKLGSK